MVDPTHSFSGLLLPRNGDVAQLCSFLLYYQTGRLGSLFLLLSVCFSFFVKSTDELRWFALGTHKMKPVHVAACC